MGRNYSKVSNRPRRPYEQERLNAELILVGEYGLKNKRELHRVSLALSKVRKAARVLLTLPEENQRRIFEGNALLRRMVRYALLDESKKQLDYVLALTTQDVLERRLQTLVYKLDLAKSVHESRVRIYQRHIRVARRIVNVPSFMVSADSQKHIDYALSSPFGGGPPGHVRRKHIALKKEDTATHG